MPDKTPPADWPGPDELEKPPMAKFFAEARQHGIGLLGPQARILPYTGIAGFTTAQEVHRVVADSPTIFCFGTPHFGHRQLAIGVLVSQETMDGRPPRKYPDRYPAIDKIREIIDAASLPYVYRVSWQPKTEGTIFDLRKRCLRLIHYSGPGEGLCTRLDRLCEIAGPNLDGFQLNMVWPPAAELKSWAMDHPTMRVILQVNRRMYAHVARTPKMLIDEIAKTYLPWCITDILFDLSGGTGLKIDLAGAWLAIKGLYDAFGGQVGIGLAGGLDKNSVRELKPFFQKWPDLSIDAEGMIRDVILDEKDPEKIIASSLGTVAREYVRRSICIIPLR